MIEICEICGLPVKEDQDRIDDEVLGLCHDKCILAYEDDEQYRRGDEECDRYRGT